MKRWLMAILMMMVVANSPAAFAALHTEAVPYQDGDVQLEGFLAYDDAQTGKRPGVLVVHEWKGLGDYAKHRAEMLAQLGYVAFAVDMYGKGVFAKDHEEAAKFSGALRNDRAKMRRRIGVALDLFRQRAEVDPGKIVAIGYCFGGTTVLELARSGADVKAVVSFHGALDTPTPADAGQIKAKVLVCHGADDKFIPAEVVTAFQDEMRNGGVDWELNIYGDAVHSFTVPEAGADKSSGIAYNEKADQRSWAAMRRLFDEVFR